MASPLLASWRVLDHVGFPFLPADKAKLLQENVLPSIAVFGWTDLKHVSSRGITMWLVTAVVVLGHVGAHSVVFIILLSRLETKISTCCICEWWQTDLFLLRLGFASFFPSLFCNSLFPFKECRIPHRLYLPLVDVFRLSQVWNSFFWEYSKSFSECIT